MASLTENEDETKLKSCSCAVDGRQSKLDYCPNMNKLDNHVDCPSFDDIPHEQQPCEPYWRLIKGSMKQVRHWCFMGEIKDVSLLSRPRLLVRTRFGEDVLVSFHLERQFTPRTFSFNDAVVGHTVLIVDAEKQGFIKISIEQEFGDLIVIFKCSMQTLMKTFQSMIASPAVCFQCQAQSSSTTTENNSLKKCSKCKVTLYCSSSCQTQHWHDSHKKLCVSMKYLKLLNELDFTKTSVISKKCQTFSFAV